MAHQCYTYNDMCQECRQYYSLLARDTPAAKFARHPGEAYERPQNTYPVIFTAQYRTVRPRKDGLKIPREATECLSAWFKQPVAVYADIRSFVPRTPGQQPFLWISILIDFPGKVRVDQDLMDHIFGDSASSSIHWHYDNPADPDDMDFAIVDDYCLVRLEWFMRRHTRLPSGQF
ncbi:hypothetical protein BJY04DRAFT_191225 [Aspergillus karnatakaensis]|uniref:uncharacterized protein n=1 Tax=Aspergillus karnatakaensis TaxID=1810916 RepID=UPI003CCD8446